MKRMRMLEQQLWLWSKRYIRPYFYLPADAALRCQDNSHSISKPKKCRDGQTNCVASTFKSHDQNTIRKSRYMVATSARPGETCPGKASVPGGARLQALRSYDLVENVREFGTRPRTRLVLQTKGHAENSSADTCGGR